MARAMMSVLALLQPALLRAAGRDLAAESPIQKVVTLLTEMKAQTEQEAKDDLEAYDKYNCWCITNDKEKVAAIKEAKQIIGDLSAFLEEAAAREGQLKTEVSELQAGIQEDKDALATATSVRAQELAAFKALEADSKQTRGLLSQAVDTISKSQLLQKTQGHAPEAVKQAAAAAFVQVRDVVVRRYPQFQSVMQRDLFDVMGSLDGFEAAHQPRETAASLLGEAFLPRRPAAALAQQAQPKSYNAQSGAIVGILSGMLDTTSKELGAAQRQDLDAEIQFQHLRAAKTGEIFAAEEQIKEKAAALAELSAQVAQAKKDLKKTSEALEADQEFLTNLRAGCKVEEEEYKKRYASRSEEIRALGEALQILTEDEARDLFGKTISFLQLASAESVSAAERVAREDRVAEKAMQRIASVAKKHNNWGLISLAVRVRLDSFTKVKEAMDTMLAELKKQQGEEYEKREFCNKAIDETEDLIKEATYSKEDLDRKHLQLTNTIDTLNREIEALKAEVAQMEVGLKQAGEQRKAQNKLFQTSIADQRATINILLKAQKRLQAFYTLVEVHQHGHAAAPGEASSAAPPKPQKYEKHGTAGGVLQLLAVIVNDAESTEKELEISEQHSQKIYAGFVADTAASIEKDRALIQEKIGLVAANEGDKSETQGAQLANNQELEKLTGLLQAHHVDCDFLLQYFDVRQQARAQEMDAIEDAKAILSGANFGK